MESIELEYGKGTWETLKNMLIKLGHPQAIPYIEKMVRLNGADWAFNNFKTMYSDLPDNVGEILQISFRYLEYAHVIS